MRGKGAGQSSYLVFIYGLHNVGVGALTPESRFRLITTVFRRRHRRVSDQSAYVGWHVHANLSVRHGGRQAPHTHNEL